MFSTPVLFLAFNRPESTKRVFETFRQIKPKKLFVSADGPRINNLNDFENCAEVRKIIDQGVDWDCEVFKLYRKENVGCKLAVSEAITWFFQEVDKGIIIEDDCLPELDFFNYCQDLLSFYENDKRIMQIGGYNYNSEWRSKHQKYHFSYLGSIWGWATWKRAWELYDVNISNWGNSVFKEQLLSSYVGKTYLENRKYIINNLFEKKIDTWDYQWTLAKISNNGLSITPSLNLIKNIGFGELASNTIAEIPSWMSKESYSLRIRNQYNKFLIPDTDFDELYLKNTSLPKDGIIRRLKGILKFSK